MEDALQEASPRECGQARISGCGWKKKAPIRRSKKLAFVSRYPLIDKPVWHFPTQEAPYRCWFSDSSRSWKFLHPPSSGHGLLLLDASPACLWAWDTETCCTLEGGWDAVHQILSLSRWVPKCWRPPAALPRLPEVPARPLRGPALWDIALEISQSLPARCSSSSDHKKQAGKKKKGEMVWREF